MLLDIGTVRRTGRERIEKREERGGKTMSSNGLPYWCLLLDELLKEIEEKKVQQK